MGDKKHIDRLFQERFKDFEATPSDGVWDQIETKLHQKKKKRRVIPIWWRYAGIAALLLLFITAGNMYFNRNSNPSPQVVDTEKTDSKETSFEKSVGFENLLNTTDAISNNNITEDSLKEDTQNKPEKLSPHLIPSKEASIAKTSTSVNDKNTTHNSSSNKIFKANKGTVIAKNQYVVAETSEEKNNTIQPSNNSQNTNKVIQETKNNTSSLIDTKKVEDVIKNASQSKIAITKSGNTTSEKSHNKDSNTDSENEKNKLSIEEVLDKNKDAIVEEKPLNRWRIAPNAAPVYFNTLGDGSSIDSQFNNNSKTGEVNMSYGITASYAINKKLSVRSGINRVNLGYNTNNVIVFQSVGLGSSTSSLKNVNGSAGSGDNVSIISGENINSSTIPDSFESYNTSINQAFGYVEIPLEIQYAISNNKFGITVIGGFSSLFLSNNKLYSEAENGSRTFLGEANNINKMSYSANFGLGLNYKVSEKLDLNLEPMFKYQINTFNNTSGDFKPYFIGVYTGFAIKF